MSVILSIETSTPVCSVAIHNEQGLVAMTNLHKGMSHSSLLNPVIQSLLQLTDLPMSELTAIAISKGPGSYTGLRIGTSTAKGLCYALDIPLISVETLKAMASGVQNPDEYFLCPMLDARRMEVYTSIYNNELSVIKETSPIVLDGNSFADILKKQKIIFFGNGSAKLKGVISNPNAYFIDNVEPDAQYVGTLALKKFEEGQFEDLAYFEPYYLKEFKATKPKSML